MKNLKNIINYVKVPVASKYLLIPTLDFYAYFIEILIPQAFIFFYKIYILFTLTEPIFIFYNQIIERYYKKKDLHDRSNILKNININIKDGGGNSPNESRNLKY